MTSTLVPASLGFPHLFKQTQLAGASLNVQILCHFCKGNATDSFFKQHHACSFKSLCVCSVYASMHAWLYPGVFSPKAVCLLPPNWCRLFAAALSSRGGAEKLGAEAWHRFHRVFHGSPPPNIRRNNRATGLGLTLTHKHCGHRYCELMMAIRDSTSFQSRASLQTKFECLSDAPHPARLKRPKTLF